MDCAMAKVAHPCCPKRCSTFPSGRHVSTKHIVRHRWANGAPCVDTASEVQTKSQDAGLGLPRRLSSAERWIGCTPLMCVVQDVREFPAKNPGHSQNSIKWQAQRKPERNQALRRSTSMTLDRAHRRSEAAPTVSRTGCPYRHRHRE